MCQVQLEGIIASGADFIGVIRNNIVNVIGHGFYGATIHTSLLLGARRSRTKPLLFRILKIDLTSRYFTVMQVISYYMYLEYLTDQIHAFFSTISSVT